MLGLGIGLATHPEMVAVREENFLHSCKQ